MNKLICTLVVSVALSACSQSSAVQRNEPAQNHKTTVSGITVRSDRTRAPGIELFLVPRSVGNQEWVTHLNAENLNKLRKTAVREVSGENGDFKFQNLEAGQYTIIPALPSLGSNPNTVRVPVTVPLPKGASVYVGSY